MAAVIPSPADAVPALHRRWQDRTEAWRDLARELPGLSPGLARAEIRRVVEELRNRLLPYIRLEEDLLDGHGGADRITTLEHRAIRRAVRSLDDLVGSDTLDVPRVQALLAMLHGLLADHLRHEQQAYLPRLP